MLEGQAFEPADRLAQFMRMVDAFERDEIEAAADALIARLDECDGDSDLEDDDRAAIVMGELARDRDYADEPLPPPDGSPGDPEDAEEDDPPEDEHDQEVDDADREGGTIPETGAGYQGTGGDLIADDDQEEDAADIRARRPHRDRIRQTRCDRIVYPVNPFTGRVHVNFRLRDPSAGSRRWGTA